MQELERAYRTTTEDATTAPFTAEREAHDAEYTAALQADNDRDEEERQREEAEQALARPVQVDIVWVARLRRLEDPTSDRGTSPTGHNS